MASQQNTIWRNPHHTSWIFQLQSPLPDFSNFAAPEFRAPFKSLGSRKVPKMLGTWVTTWELITSPRCDVGLALLEKSTTNRFKDHLIPCRKTHGFWWVGFSCCFPLLRIDINKNHRRHQGTTSWSAAPGSVPRGGRRATTHAQTCHEKHGMLYMFSLRVAMVYQFGVKMREI